jgi:transposase
VGLVFIQRASEGISKKKLGYRFRRFRKCIKVCQDPEKYEALVRQLCELLYLEEQGYLKLYYGDESGFCLDPCLPYGWQPKEEYIRIAPKKIKRYNVFGLLSRDNHLQAYASEHTMNGDMIIAFLDDFANQLTQKTVVVLDNAPIHHTKEFEEKIVRWKEQDLYIFFLPTYSPHLNLIETLWRKAKYEWLKPQDYLCWDSLTTAVDNIMSNVGNAFSINFGELKHYTQFKTSFIFD